ncbi:phage tail protein [Lactiplantibacillus plantarum]|uniref:phage tail protein n=1 Tax=Lactiplantibacillus plantarum TaxID=1590 RepID=UPI003EBAF892
MAESNATQVILTDDGIKIIKAQNTADNAASGVTDLNDPNLMSVIEKQTQTAQYAGLTSQYNVVLARAKEANISTTALTTAYTSMNTFMTAILTDTTKASDVNRDTYKSLTDAYNTALSNVQTALSNNFNTDISNMQSSVSVASQAASSAATVASQATVTGNNASQVASQAASAANQASADYTALSAGVKDGSVVHITTKTAIDSAVIGTAEIADAAITDAKMGSISANHLTAGTIDASKVTVANLDASNITTGTLDTDRLNVGKLSALSANLGDVTTGSLKGVDIVANSFSTPNGSFTTDSNGNVVASNLTIRGVTNLVYNAALLGGNGSSIPGWGLNGEPYYSNAVLFDGLPAITWNGDATGRWDNYANSKFQPVTQTGIPYSASIKFKDYGSASGMLYTFTLGFFSAYDANTRVGYLQQVYTTNGSDSGIQTFTINNAIVPSNAKYVAIQLYAYNGKGHAAFSSPMLTQTAQSTGYQPDTGNVVSAGEIDGSVINGSTINGTTFNAGDIISNANNTAQYYPMTITPDGTYKSTYFDSAVGLQSSVASGAISYKYRSMIGSGRYLAYDSVINGQGFESQSGYTSAKDTTFSNPETITGYVNVTPASGIYLYGPTQKINFAGNADNIGSNGITMDAYGNIYAQANSSYWRIRDINSNDIVDFGIDTAGANNIFFHRELDIGNFHINTSHIRLSSIVDDVNVTKQWQLPDIFISRDEDGKLCGVDDSVLLNATLATVQEQQKQIDQLNGHNMELEARLNKLEAKLNG